MLVYNPENSKMSEFIRCKRKSFGITQAKLAEIVGVSTNTISSWETGEKAPNVAHQERLCDVFKCTKASLLSGDENGNETIYLQKLLEVSKITENLKKENSELKHNKESLEYQRDYYRGIGLVLLAIVCFACTVICATLNEFVFWHFISIFFGLEAIVALAIGISNLIKTTKKSEDSTFYV